MKNVMKKLLVMYIVLLLAGAAKGDYIYPCNGDVDIGICPRLQWEQEEEALYVWYLDKNQINVCQAAVAGWNVENRGMTRSGWVQVTDLEYDTRYYWRVDMFTNRPSFEKGSIYNFETITMPEVPEPATICLLGLGIMMAIPFKSKSR